MGRISVMFSSNLDKLKKNIIRLLLHGQNLISNAHHCAALNKITFGAHYS